MASDQVVWDITATMCNSFELYRWHTKEQGVLQIDWVCVPTKSEKLGKYMFLN